MYWYEMKESSMANLIALISYDRRIYIAKMREKSFVNQRLIGFNPIDDNIDIDLCHALLNSLISIFYIEALGFGRGLGVLDLNSDKIKNDLFMPNPYLINQSQKESIKEKFSALIERPVLPLEEELKQEDRQEFDNEILRAYGIFEYKEKIVDALLQLHKTRLSVR